MAEGLLFESDSEVVAFVGRDGSKPEDSPSSSFKRNGCVDGKGWGVVVSESLRVAITRPSSVPRLVSNHLSKSTELVAQRYPKEYPALRQIAVSFARSYLAGFLISSVPQIVRLFIAQLSSRPPKSLSARQLLTRLAKIVWKSSHSHLVLELLTLFGSYQSILFLISLVWKRRLREDHKQSIVKQLGFVKKVFRSTQTTPAATSPASGSSSVTENSLSSTVAPERRAFSAIATTESALSTQLLLKSYTSETLSDSFCETQISACTKTNHPLTATAEQTFASGEDDLTQCVIAAVISSSLCLPILTGAQRLDFGLFAIVRAVDSICSHHFDAFNNWFEAHVPKGALIIDNMDTLAFVGSVTEILYSWFYVPNALPSSYSNWIARMSGTEACIYELPRFYRENKNAAELADAPIIKKLQDLCVRRQVDPALALPSNGYIPCEVMHEGIQGCVNFWASKWMQSFSMSVKIYLPIHLLPILIFHPKLLMRTSQWPNTIARLLLSTCRSAAFLSTFIFLVFAPICVLRNILHNDTPVWGPLAGSFLSGWSLLIEKKKRRREFALYVIPRAMESLMYRTRLFLMKRGNLNHGAHVNSRALVRDGMFGYGGLESLMWITGVSFFLVGSKVQPDALRGNARKIMSWFLAQDVPMTSPPSDKWTLTGFAPPDFSSLRGFSPSRLATATFSSLPSFSDLATVASTKVEIFSTLKSKSVSLFDADSGSDADIETPVTVDSGDITGVKDVNGLAQDASSSARHQK